MILSYDTLLAKFCIWSILLITTTAGLIRSRKLNLPNCIILDSYVVEDFILADEPFVKASRMFEACVLIDNNLSEKWVLILDLPAAFDARFKDTSVPVLILDLNLLSSELGSCRSTVLYWLVLSEYFI